MKTTSLIVAVGLLGFAGMSMAEEAEAKPKKGVAPDILAKYDKDQDGKLSKEEKAEWQKDKAKEPKPEKPKKEPKPIDPEILKKYDTNGDGKLCKEEKAAMKKEKAKEPKPEKAKKPKKEPKPKKTKEAPAEEF